MKLNNSIIKVLLVLLSFTALVTSCKKGEPEAPEPQEITKPISYNDLSFTDVKAQLSKMTNTHIVATSSANIWNSENIIVFKTNENRFGKFRITNIDINQNFRLSIVATVYNADGSTKYLEKAIVIEGTFVCDLDQGISSNAETADFHWNRREPNLTWLLPNNEAVFYQYK